MKLTLNRFISGDASASSKDLATGLGKKYEDAGVLFAIKSLIETKKVIDDLFTGVFLGIFFYLWRQKKNMRFLNWLGQLVEHTSCILVKNV